MSFLKRPHVSVFFRKGMSTSSLGDCTHLAIGAHPDDIEIMAGHGILEGLLEGNEFVAVTCCNGSQGSSVDDISIEIRKKEQLLAAQKGHYQACFLLGYESEDVKRGLNPKLLDDLQKIIQETNPQFIYTHNPIDRHGTHRAISCHVVEVLKRMSYRPKELFGCEVWRSLDWVPDSLKCVLPISDPEFLFHLIALYESQIRPGKNYAEATRARFCVNATYKDFHQADVHKAFLYGISLLPLLDKNTSMADFVRTFIQSFAEEVGREAQSFPR